MTTFRGRIIASLLFIVVAFAGLIVYAVRVAPKMGREAKIALDVFYGKCRDRDYRGAHALFSTPLQESVSIAQLEKKWTEFGAKHGAFQRWQSTETVTITGFAGSVCVFPPFVDFHYGAAGSKGTGTLIQTRMVPENGQWKVERFNFLQMVERR